MLYDGDCPLCMKEVDFLRRRDAGRGAIDFVDVAAAEYSAERNAGIDFETAMGEIHAILPDGAIVTKVGALVGALFLGLVLASGRPLEGPQDNSVF